MKNLLSLVHHQMGCLVQFLKNIANYGLKIIFGPDTCTISLLGCNCAINDGISNGPVQF